jgi:DNA repair photolyase
MPFRWTLNVYRGCSHACTYCLAGDTAILMADGQTTPLADIRVGDRIFGTERRGPRRQLISTEVSAHWQSVRPAIRIGFHDGTSLVSSGDHRFLSGDGWKQATALRGRQHRPHLSVNDTLISTSPQAPLRITSIESLDRHLPMYDITTGTGDFIANGVVSHNCFARPTHEFLGLNIGEDFDRRIVVKINAVERLRAELADPTWLGEPVAMGTNTDPYQRAEGRFRLTRGVLRELARRSNPFSILTKSPLVTRDLDLLTEAACTPDVSVNFSLATLDERVWRASEPGTPHPRRRLEAMRQLHEAGIRTGALIAPVLPGLSDRPEQLRDVVRAVRDAGGSVLGVLPLHLRSGTREHFLRWLAGFDPALHANYLRRYAHGAYAPEHYGARLRALVEGDDT